MTSEARRDADRLAELLRTEHHARADFLLALAAFDHRRGWAALGHASLWAFLHHDLGLSAGAAFQRKEAAALLRRIPEVEAPLRDGRLCLSSVAELAKVLTPENLAAVLPRFFGKSAREAREVVAALSPREAVPARTVVTAVASVARVTVPFQTSETGMTHPGREPRLDAGPLALMPQPSTPSPAPDPTLDPNSDATSGHGPSSPRSTAQEAHQGTARSQTGNMTGSPTPSTTSTLPSTSTRTAVEPLTADLRRLHITVSRRFLRKLDAARCARAHADPTGSIEAVLEEALDLLLVREARRLKAATNRPAAASRATAVDHVPAQVRREVWARDEGRCQWPVEAGGVCGSTWQVEIDHVWPKARGGPPTVANLRLLCRPHNAEAARRVYGEGWMAGARSRKAAGGTRKGDGPSTRVKGPSEQLPRYDSNIRPGD